MKKVNKHPDNANKVRKMRAMQDRLMGMLTIKDREMVTTTKTLSQQREEDRRKNWTALEPKTVF